MVGDRAAITRVLCLGGGGGTLLGAHSDGLVLAIIVIAEMLGANGGLTHLDVTYNQLGEDGRSVLSDAVKGRDGFTLKLKGEYERECAHEREGKHDAGESVRVRESEKGQQRTQCRECVSAGVCECVSV